MTIMFDQQSESISVMKSKRIGFIIFIFLFSFATYVGYTEFVAPYFHYHKMYYIFDIEKIEISLIIILFFAIFGPTNMKIPSNFFLTIQMLFPLIPMAVIHACNDMSTQYFMYCVMAFCVMCIFSKIRIPIPGGIGISLQSIGYIFVFICGFSYIYLLVVTGFSSLTLSLEGSDVYTARASTDIPLGIFGYLISWSRSTFIGAVCAIGLCKRDRRLIIIGLLLSISAFVTTSHKSPLVIWISIYIVFHALNNKKMFYALAIILICIPIYSLWMFLLNDVSFGTYIFRRIYIIPGWLNFMYFDTFDNFGQIYWAGTLLGDLFGVILDIDSSKLVGHYFAEDSSANTGWLGTGYMNFGLLGMCFYAIIIGLTLSFMDSCARYLDSVLVILLFFMPVKNMMDSTDVPTTFLGYGLIVIMLIAWLATPSDVASMNEFSETRNQEGS